MNVVETTTPRHPSRRQVRASLAARGVAVGALLVGAAHDIARTAPIHGSWRVYDMLAYLGLAWTTLAVVAGTVVRHLFPRITVRSWAYVAVVGALLTIVTVAGRAFEPYGRIGGGRASLSLAECASVAAGLTLVSAIFSSSSRRAGAGSSRRVLAPAFMKAMAALALLAAVEALAHHAGPGFGAPGLARSRWGEFTYVASPILVHAYVGLALIEYASLGIAVLGGVLLLAPYYGRELAPAAWPTWQWMGTTAAVLLARAIRDGAARQGIGGGQQTGACRRTSRRT